MCPSRVIEQRKAQYLTILSKLANTTHFLAEFRQTLSYISVAGRAYLVGGYRAASYYSFSEDQNSRENVAGFQWELRHPSDYKQDFRRTYFIFSSQNSSVSFSVVSCVILVPR